MGTDILDVMETPVLDWFALSPLLVLLGAWFFHGQSLSRLRLVLILGGITGGVTVAAVIGAAMPNILRFFDREPQVAAGPIALAATDMATLTIYFSIARWLLG